MSGRSRQIARIGERAERVACHVERVHEDREDRYGRRVVQTQKHDTFFSKFRNNFL